MFFLSESQIWIFFSWKKKTSIYNRLNQVDSRSDWTMNRINNENIRQWAEISRVWMAFPGCCQFSRAYSWLNKEKNDYSDATIDAEPLAQKDSSQRQTRIDHICLLACQCSSYFNGFTLLRSRFISRSCRIILVLSFSSHIFLCSASSPCCALSLRYFS